MRDGRVIADIGSGLDGLAQAVERFLRRFFAAVFCGGLLRRFLPAGRNFDDLHCASAEPFRRLADRIALRQIRVPGCVRVHV